MPYVEYTYSPIIINLSNKIIGSTILKRKAQVNELLISPVSGRVIVSITVLPFSQDANDAYGVALDGNTNIIRQTLSFTADNNQLVDVADGSVLGPASLLDDPQSEDEGHPLNGKTYMREFDYLMQISESTPIIINQLIRAKIEELDLRGKI